jgi:hypothetical protein
MSPSGENKFQLGSYNLINTLPLKIPNSGQAARFEILYSLKNYYSEQLV